MTNGKKALALLLLLGLAFAAAPTSRAASVEDDEYEDPDGPPTPSAFLLVRRKLSDEKPQVGQMLTVTVEVHNSGEAAATDVEIKEDGWPGEAFLTEGTLEASYASIPAGATQSFAYTVTPKYALPRYEQRPALVTYVAADGEKPVTTSSPVLAFAIYTSGDVMLAKALRVGSFVTLGMLNTQKEWLRFLAVAGGAVLVYVLLSAYRTATKTREHSRRQRALRDLGMEDMKTK